MTTSWIELSLRLGRAVCSKGANGFGLGTILRPLTDPGASRGGVGAAQVRCISSSLRHVPSQQYKQRSRHAVDKEEASADPRESALEGINDRYRGVHLDLDQVPSSCPPSRFASLLKASLESWLRNNRSSAWIRIPIEKSHFIPEAAKLGFRFHHADNNESVLCLWLRQDVHSLLPPYATHQVGVAGCVVNKETNQVLVVKDKTQSHKLWKFPGGLADLNEDIDNTAKREVWEETGLQTDFLGVLAFRQQHQHPDAFDRSDLFFVCLLTPTTFDLRPCSEEIAACQWMPVDALAASGTVSAIAKRCLQLVGYGLKGDRLDEVLIRVDECRSLYKGRRKMKLFTRSVRGVDDADFDLGDYPYDATAGDQFNPRDVTTHERFNWPVVLDGTK